MNNKTNKPRFNSAQQKALDPPDSLDLPTKYGKFGKSRNVGCITSKHCKIQNN